MKAGPGFWLVAMMLLLLTLFVHLWRLDSAPPGFFCDESSNAYNAYCIAKTGADEYGTPFPVFFRALEDYRDPLLIYSTAPSVGFFGLQRWAARLPSAIFGVLASIAFACLVQECCREQWLSLMAGVCCSIIPWLFPTSRIAAGGHTPLVFGMTAGCLLILLALRKQSFGCAIGAGLAWVFAMYSYSLGRPLFVLTLVCLGLAFPRALLKRWRIVVAFLGSCLTALLPMVVSVAREPRVLTARFQDIWISRPGTSGRAALFTDLLPRYAEYFSPAFLFLKGDHNLRQHTGVAGELFIFLIPLILAGVYCLVRFARRQPYYRFIGLELLAYPIIAALTPDRMHTIRSINGVIFWLLAAAIGARYLWLKRGWARVLLLGACCFGIIESGLYLTDYFGPYQARSRAWFNASHIETLQDCFALLDTNQTLYLSQSAFSPIGGILGADFKPFVYVDILFFGNIDPAIYRAGGIPQQRVCLYDGTLPRPGLLLRCNQRLQQPKEVQHASAYNIFRGPHQYVDNEEPIPDGARLIRIKPISAGLRYELYEVD